MSFGFNESYYLSNNPDVTAAVARGQFLSGYDHFVKLGAAELRNPNAFFNAQEYAAANPDVLSAVSQRVFPSLWDHYINFGLAEGRAPNASLAGFNAAAYLAANPDVAAAVTAGTIKNPLQHYLSFGAQEGRSPLGADGQPLTGGTGGQTFTLTGNVDGPNAVSPAINTDGTAGNDTYIGTFTSAQGDFINGKGGTDTLKLTGAGTATVSLTSVEHVQGSAIGGTGTINIAGSTGIKTLEAVNGTDALTFSGVANLTDLRISNQSDGNVTVTYTPATVVGATDVQKVAIENYGLKSVAGTNSIGLAGIETVELTATGVNRFTGITDTALQTVKVTGAGSVRIDTDLGNSVKTFDASAATGDIRVGFAVGGDVAVTTGSGNDRVSFAGATDFTTKDVVDLGAGTTDTLVLTGSDISLATNEQLKAINAVKGLEILEFTGAPGVTLDQKTLTNSGVTKVVFDTAGNDVVTNADVAHTYAFGTNSAGNETFTLAGTNTTLNLALEGSSKTATKAIDDADVGVLTVNGTGALTVNLSSQGSTDATVDFKAALVGADFNNIATFTAAANTTLNLSGNANTQIAATTNAVNLQAGSLTATLIAFGSGSDDILVGGSVHNWLKGGAGADTIDISKSSTVAGDWVDISDVTASTGRDTIIGFQVGAGGDQLVISAGNTTATTAAAATVALQEVSSNTGNITFNTAANDVLELNFNIAGTTLAGATDGSALLAAVGNLSVSADANKGYVVAYQGGNAYVYYVSEAANAGAEADNVLSAADVALVGVVNGAAVGSFEASNFHLLA